jgi:CheY-like chemotaxis protein
MTQPLCAVCGRPMVWMSVFLFARDLILTARCAECGWGDTIIEKRSTPERAAGEAPRPGLHVPAPVRILMVDDDPTLRAVLAELVCDLGYQLKAVPDAEQALDLLRKEPFDILLTDTLLPGMDGWHLIAGAIHEQPMLRPVAMTGADVEGDRERARALNVPMLQKPFTRVELRNALQEALGGAHMNAHLCLPQARG